MKIFSRNFYVWKEWEIGDVHTIKASWGGNEIFILPTILINRSDAGTEILFMWIGFVFGVSDY